ncbi:hypothetical protein [Taklimakanibacter deserti]|uniref:hypothetical protein n=1 Tax=Taklimakanibacter deserti TaxID=2267839 RepID=UPI003F6866C0
MAKVTGIGGLFFRARNPAALALWYETHLGIGSPQTTIWRQEAGATVFAPFAEDTDYFRPEQQCRPVAFCGRGRGRDVALEIVPAAEAAAQHDAVFAIDMPEGDEIGRGLILGAQFLDRGTHPCLGISASGDKCGKAVDAALAIRLGHARHIEDQDGEGRFGHWQNGAERRIGPQGQGSPGPPSSFA